MNPFDLQVFEKQRDACEFSEHHFCAACWDFLINRPEAGGYLCECIRCKENTKGYTSRKYVARRLEESERRSREAMQYLRPYVPWLQRKATELDNLKELGF